MPMLYSRYAVGLVSLPIKPIAPFLLENARGTTNRTRVAQIKQILFRKRYDRLIFFGPPKANLAKAADVARYARTQASIPTGKMKGSQIAPGATPIDITLERQGVVVLEPDLAINWRFAPGDWGTSTEEPFGCDEKGEDFGTPSVAEDGMPIEGRRRRGIARSSTCRRRGDCWTRGPTSSTATSSSTNPTANRARGRIIGGLKSKPTGSSRRLPIIFDPEIVKTNRQLVQQIGTPSSLY